MSDSAPVAAETASAFIPHHPLEPLTAQEINSASAILRVDRSLGPRTRFVTITLHEPAKEVVLAFQDGDPIDRQAFIILLDKERPATYEAIVSITHTRVVSWQHIPNAQPAITFDEITACDDIIKAHPGYITALAKRGITNLDEVTIDTWSPGCYDTNTDGTRLLRALSFIRTNLFHNGYAQPIEGLIVLLDLNTMQVIDIEDHGVVPIPPYPSTGNYTPDLLGRQRTDQKKLEISQPDGPSFTVRGHDVQWQKWSMRLGFTPREGLVLHTIGYEDQGRVRSIIYRASLSEMVVPYGDPGPTHYRKNAFDVGEYGVGTLANALTLGCDCLGEIRYFDGVIADADGHALVLSNAICMHEEDYGVGWKHFDWRSDNTEVRRSRRLVISSFCTIDNYEYGFFWYFYQDGSIQYEVKLTGIVSTGAVAPGDLPAHGQLIAPQLYAPSHQHFFNVRLDMAIDGTNNSVYEVNTEAVPLGPRNPHGNAFVAVNTLLAAEQQAQRMIDPFTARSWTIVNPAVKNYLGQPVGYKLAHGENAVPFAHRDSSIMKRAGFMNKHLWVTPYHPAERYAAGDYPNQNPNGDGLPVWTQANRSVENTDVVIWYTFGHHHIPRPEDWPVMPTAYIGFMLKPVGFFNANPAIDTPVPESHGECCATERIKEQSSQD